MQLISAKKNIVIIILLVFLQIPFLEFAVENLVYIDQIFKTLISLYIISIIIGLLISKILNYIFSSKFNDFLLVYIIINFLVFKWHNFNLFIKPFLSSTFPFVSLSIIIITIFTLSYLIFIRKNESTKLFVYIFFITYFIYLISQIVMFQNDNNLEKNINFKNFNNVINSKNIDKSIDKNIYLIVLDGMISSERFEKIYLSEDIFLKHNLESEKFKKIENIKSSYFDTGLTIGSVFNLNYISEDYAKINLDTLYPGNLYKKNLKNNEPNLIKILNNYDYNFVWYSNYITNCRIINNNFCGDSTKGKLDQFINIYVGINFLSGSPIVAFTNKINPNLLLKLYHKKNDALKNFLNNSKFYETGGKNFFLIHSLMPHSPFVYNENCGLVNNENNMTIGYKMNYLCAVKRIKEFQNYILSKDRDAVVVIQSDHGYFFRDNAIYNKRNDKDEFVQMLFEKNKKELIDNYNILTIIKKNECEFPKGIILDNVNSIIFALNCALNENLAYKNKKTFYGYNKLLK